MWQNQSASLNDKRQTPASFRQSSNLSYISFNEVFILYAFLSKESLHDPTGTMDGKLRFVFRDNKWQAVKGSGQISEKMNLYKQYNSRASAISKISTGNLCVILESAFCWNTQVKIVWNLDQRRDKTRRWNNGETYVHWKFYVNMHKKTTLTMQVLLKYLSDTHTQTEIVMIRQN